LGSVSKELVHTIHSSGGRNKIVVDNDVKEVGVELLYSGICEGRHLCFYVIILKNNKEK
jgi:hypothetical protein